MKYCNRCLQNLPLSDFTSNPSRKDGLQYYCKECMKIYRLEHYRRNKQAHYRRNNKTTAKLINIVLAVKVQGCTDCGVVYPEEPWLIDLDHIKDKEIAISQIVRLGSEKRLREELAKCEPVCLICHRRRTALRGNWIKNRFENLGT